MVDHVASPKAIVPAALASALLLRRHDGAAEMALGTSVAVLTTQAVKHLVSRRRPRLLCETPWQSFPSGHSAASTAWFVGLALVAPPAHRAVAVGAACLGAVGVNSLRVARGEHWPSDVVAGDVVGLAGIATAYLVLRAFRRRREPVAP